VAEIGTHLADVLGIALIVVMVVASAWIANK
jgi:hypothetical protein